MSDAVEETVIEALPTVDVPITNEAVNITEPEGAAKATEITPMDQPTVETTEGISSSAEELPSAAAESSAVSQSLSVGEEDLETSQKPSDSYADQYDSFNNEEEVKQVVNYEIPQLRRPQSVADLGRECSGFYHSFGKDLTRRNNVHMIERDKVMYAVGNTIVFETVSTGVRTYMLGVEDYGIGCLCVHPSSTLFAVGCKGFQPNIYIYSYPELKIVKVLKTGAERGYTSLCFNANGDKLASVATFPDYMLTVWDWEEERMGLHAKAFGQDVFAVRFSMYDDHRLTTCGTGHIRFWKMASTFTGLKLQGYIGKFGKVELSDVGAFVELPDGKVVSGTEVGALLLWEGNFIKCRFTQVGGRPCHLAEVTYVEFDEKERVVITASKDGFIRWWDFDAIDAAEVDSDVTLDFELMPVAEYNIGEGKGIQSMVDSGVIDSRYRYFVIQDTQGGSRSVQFPLKVDGGADSMEKTKSVRLCDVVQSMRDPEFLKSTYGDAVATSAQASEGKQPVFTYDGGKVEASVRIMSDSHAGKINGLDVSSISHLAATCGDDGTVRFWDYVNCKLLATRKFSVAATCLKWAPTTLDKDSKTVAVGFADGILKVLSLGEDVSGNPVILRKSTFKPHDAPITDISFNAEGKIVATSGKDGIVFFFNCMEYEGPNKSWTPLRFVNVVAKSDDVNNLSSSTQKSKIAAVYSESMAWKQSGDSILCTCNDNIAREFMVKEILDVEALMRDAHLTTYEIELPSREFIPMLTTTTTTSSSAPPAAGKDSQASSSSAAGDDAGAGETASSNPAPAAAAVSVETTITAPMKVLRATYAINQDNIIAGAAVGTDYTLIECTLHEPKPKNILPYGLYSTDGKDALKAPAITSIRFGKTEKYVTMGATDGSVIVRPSKAMSTFLRFSAHNSQVGGTSMTALSFDDNFVISAGSDGVLCVHRLRLTLIESLYDDLQKNIEAGIFKDQTSKAVDPAKAAGMIEPKYLLQVSDVDKINDPKFFQDPERIGASIKLQTVDTTDEVPDMASGVYSIQEAKLKSEEDLRKAAAESLKDRVRASILALQQDYMAIVEKNNALPPEVRLTPQQMAVDGELLVMLAQKNEELLEEVHKECAYETEKASVLLKKVKNGLLSDILVEEIPLYAFDVSGSGATTSMVKSLRSMSLSSKVAEILEKIHKEMTEREINEAQKFAQDALKLTDKEDDNNSTSSKLKKAEAAGSKKEAHGGSALAHRREMRKERKKALAAHEKERPNENEDDERDVQTIKVAEKTVGNLKLKCSDDYEVPEGQRVNALKKRQQMAMMEESMLTMRLKFNERFLKLRDLKRVIVNTILQDNERIRQIDKELQQEHLSDDLWEPSLEPLEYPDDREFVTEEQLFEYKENRKKNPWIKSTPYSHSIISGSKTKVWKDPHTETYALTKADIAALSGQQTDSIDAVNASLRVSHSDKFALSNNFVYPDPVVKQTERMTQFYEVKDTVLSAVYTPIPDPTFETQLESFENMIPVLAAAREAKVKTMELADPTPSQLRARLERTRRLKFERMKLLEKNSINVRDFNAAVEDLRVQRHQVTAELKMAELKFLVVYQEYLLMLTFENRDATLQQKQLKCQGEREEISKSLKENKDKLDSKMADLKEWSEKVQGVHADMKNAVPESHQFHEQLMKIFKKKIKRVKNDGKEEDEEEEEEEEEEDDDDDENGVEDACPSGCDQNLYENVLEMREKRLDLEDVAAETQKAVDDLKRALDRAKQREKQVIKDSHQADLEVQQFQLQKQVALNQIEVKIPLRMSQLYVFETSGKLTGPQDVVKRPEDSDDAELLRDIATLKSVDERRIVSEMSMTSHVLISDESFKGLGTRIGELHVECDEARASFKELRKEKGRLAKERELMRQQIEGLRSKCRDLQMLKFGRVIDIEELEAGSDRQKENEIEDQIKKEEEAFEAATRKLTHEREELEKKLVEITSKNTSLLNAIAQLQESKIEISRELNAPNTSMTQDTKGDDIRDREEKKRISAYIDLQAREIDALKAEIAALKRKDSQPLPPTMPYVGAQGSLSESSAISQSPSHFQNSQVLDRSQNQQYEPLLPPIPNVTKTK